MEEPDEGHSQLTSPADAAPSSLSNEVGKD